MKAGNQTVWFHFGGEVYELALQELFPGFFARPVIAGMALSAHPGFIAAALGSIKSAALERFVRGEGLRLLEDEGQGRFVEDLPEAGVEALLAELRIDQKFTTWAAAREVLPVSPIEKWPALKNLLASG